MAELPFTLRAILCDLRPRFIPKGTAGRGWQAVSRNGRVLLCSDLPAGDLEGVTALVRLQRWHKALLPGDAPEPYGILLHVRTQETQAAGPLWTGRLARAREATGEILLDVGGERVLVFNR